MCDFSKIFYRYTCHWNKNFHLLVKVIEDRPCNIQYMRDNVFFLRAVIGKWTINDLRFEKAESK